jgi:hypothetical protein
VLTVQAVFPTGRDSFKPYLLKASTSLRPSYHTIHPFIHPSIDQSASSQETENDDEYAKG